MPPFAKHVDTEPWFIDDDDIETDAIWEEPDNNNPIVLVMLLCASLGVLITVLLSMCALTLIYSSTITSFMLSIILIVVAAWACTEAMPIILLGTRQIMSQHVF